MSEILDFPKQENDAASGRFFMSALGQLVGIMAEHQMMESQLETERLLKAGRPSDGAISAANLELKHLFSGDNKEEAERLYQKGLSDVVSRRHLISGERSDAAKFYAHVQRLTDIANHEADELPDPSVKPSRRFIEVLMEQVETGTLPTLSNHSEANSVE